MSEQERRHSELEMGDGEERVEADRTSKVGDGPSMLAANSVDHGHVEENLRVVGDFLRDQFSGILARKRESREGRTSNRSSAVS